MTAAPGAGAPVPVYLAERLDSVEAFLNRCAPLLDGHSLPFHHPHWLRAWYAAFGQLDGQEPVLMAVRREGAADDALLLPLVLRRQGGQRLLSYADASVVDYIGPVVAADWAGGADERAAAAALWRALAGQLPGDVLSLHKMLARGLDETGHRANPLALSLPVQACEFWGNQFQLRGSEWEDWRRSLDKRVRKEIERCWRVFHRSAEARFERVTEPAEAMALFDTLERQQSERLTPLLGAGYRLDQPAYRAFYRQLIRDGLAEGSTVLTVLRDGPHVVSALFGVANQARYIALRQSIGGDSWKNCSPGRLLDEQSARHMHGLGRENFDFGVGDYFHKATLQMEQIPLLDACVALSWRGRPTAWAWSLKRWLKRQPQVMAAWRRWQSGPASAKPAGSTP